MLRFKPREKISLQKVLLVLFSFPLPQLPKPLVELGAHLDSNHWRLPHSSRGLWNPLLEVKVSTYFFQSGFLSECLVTSQKRNDVSPLFLLFQTFRSSDFLAPLVKSFCPLSRLVFVSIRLNQSGRSYQCEARPLSSSKFKLTLHITDWALGSERSTKPS